MAESIANRGRGRPVGGRRQALVSWAAQVEGRFTMHSVVSALGLSVPCANVTLARAVDSGAIRRVGTVPVAWSKRPVAQYESARSMNDLMGAMRTWMGTGHAQQAD
ncbi:hypothetical protein [Limnohabitans sp.]|uniref:hypothetical protein n=1 Tax=Limnohabitans sp. TaxID=1907725 RepID=UPI00286F68E0|nr:hypothetical protein [Limnohabitans sp.]